MIPPRIKISGCLSRMTSSPQDPSRSVVEDLDGADAFVFAHRPDDLVENFAEEGAVFAAAGRALVVGGLGRLLDVLQVGHGFVAAAGLEMLNSELDLDDVVPVGRALEPVDAHGHLALVHQRDGPVAGDGHAHAAVEVVEVLGVAGVRGEAVPGEGLRHVEAGHVVAGVPGDGHIVVVDEQLGR